VAIKVLIPGPLRAFANGAAEIEIQASPGTVGEALDELFAAHPGMRDRVVNEVGEIRRHVNIFVGSEPIRYSGGLATPVREGAEISIVPSISGGRPGS
jgi:sulfur-carrier protein